MTMLDPAREAITLPLHVLIVACVQAGGKQGRTTSEINAHGKRDGRTVDAYVALGNLVKARTLKRQNITEERGSRYKEGG